MYYHKRYYQRNKDDSYYGHWLPNNEDRSENDCILGYVLYNVVDGIIVMRNIISIAMYTTTVGNINHEQGSF